MDFLRKLKDHLIPSERNVYRPHLLRKPWLIFFLTIILTTEGVFLFDLVTRQSAFNFVAAVLPGEVIALTNTERSTHNVGTLTSNSLLTAAAQAKANDMAAKGYFAHVSPDGTEPWAWVKAAGYTYQYAGENLAVRFTDSNEVVQAWMASPSHRENMLKSQYTEIGIGVAQGEFKGEPATYIVQYFGTPRSTAPLTALAAPAVAARAPRVATASSSAPQVEGASTVAPAPEPVPSSPETDTPPQTHIQETPPWNSFAKSLLNQEAQPSSSVLWILAAIASIMVIGLALTFFVHIQIQPTDMLISGAVVAVLALAFIALNAQTNLPQNSTQSAAVFGAMPTGTGFIDAQAGATTEH